MTANNSTESTLLFYSPANLLCCEKQVKQEKNLSLLFVSKSGIKTITTKWNKLPFLPKGQKNLSSERMIFFSATFARKSYKDIKCLVPGDSVKKLNAHP